jgi:hypothetical protein
MEATSCSALEVRESNSFTDFIVHSKASDFPVFISQSTYFHPSW